MNGPRYVKSLLNKLKQHVHINRCMNFLQDGALCHRSKNLVIFLAKSKVKVLECPDDHTDLNP